MNPRNFLAELKRRRVFALLWRTVVAWLLIQIATSSFRFSTSKAFQNGGSIRNGMPSFALRFQAIRRRSGA